MNCQRLRERRAEQRSVRDDPGSDQQRSADGADQRAHGFQSGNGDAWLSWDRSTDDADPQHLIVYGIYFNGLPNYSESIIGGNSTIAYWTVQGTG